MGRVFRDPNNEASSDRRYGGVLHSTKKAIRVFTSAIFAFINCSTSVPAVTQAENQPTFDTQFDDMPSEIVMRIASHCDFAAQMNLRFTSRRMKSLVDHSELARRQVVGGIEIGSCHPPLSASILMLPQENGEDGGSDTEMDVAEELHFSVRRLSKRQSVIEMSLEQLKVFMRRLCVCHSLHIRGVSIDDTLISRLLLAEFRAIRDLVLDRVATASHAALDLLVQKVQPVQSLYLFNHTHSQSVVSISRSIVLDTYAAEIAIESARGTELFHPAFDDECLKMIVLNDRITRRSIRLPYSAITHNGIVEAVKAFYAHCIAILDSLEGTLHHEPRWELIISIALSPLIQLRHVTVPPDMVDCCYTYMSDQPSYNIEVRLGRLYLLIKVEFA